MGRGREFSFSFSFMEKDVGGREKEKRTFMGKRRELSSPYFNSSIKSFPKKKEKVERKKEKEEKGLQFPGCKRERGKVIF